MNLTLIKYIIENLFITVIYLKTAGVTLEGYIFFYLNFTGLSWKLNSGIAIVKQFFITLLLFQFLSDIICSFYFQDT